MALPASGRVHNQKKKNNAKITKKRTLYRPQPGGED